MTNMGFNFIQFRKVFSTGIKISILTIVIIFSQNLSAQTILRVDQSATGIGDGSSWTDAYINLQSALDAAATSAPAELWVKADTYLPTSSTDQTIAFLIKDQVTIYGGFDGTETLLNQRDPSKNIVIFSGDIGVSKDSTDNSHSILVVDPTTASNVMIDGVRIAHAYSSSSVGVKGAIAITSMGSILNVNDCAFYNNVGFLGAAISSFLSPVISPNNVTSSINVSRSIFYNNGGGSVLYARSNTTISDCIFMKNANEKAIEMDFGTLKMLNSTLVENAVGITLSATVIVEIYNAVIWNNTAGNIPFGSSNVIVSNSIVGGGFAGTNVLDSDPLFIDASGLDFRIQHCSPGVDAGDNTLLLGSQSLDLSGDPRTFNTTVDMGAYESQITPLFFSTISTTSISCSGATDGTISVTGGGGLFTTGPLYSIDGGSFSGNSVFSGLGAGLHTIAVQDNSGCEYSEGITLAEPDAIILTISNSTNITCNGAADGTITGTITGGSGPYDVSLDGINFGIEITNGTLNATGLSPGSYTVIAKDLASCLSSSISVTLTESSVLGSSVLAKTDITCNGGADGVLVIGISGGTPLYEYSLDGTNFQTSETFTGLAAGAYIVTVRDANGCISTISETLVEPAAITTSIGQTDLNCFAGGTGEIVVTASGGTGALSYSIDAVNFQTSSTFSGLNGGSFTITIKDALDCTTSETVTLTQPDVLAVTVTSTDVTCFSQEDGMINIDIAGGTAPYDISIGAVPVVTGNTGSYSEDEFDIGNYTYLITDANGCTVNSATVTIAQPTEISVDVALIEGDSINLSAMGGFGAIEYSLDNSIYQTSGMFKVPASGEVTVYARDANQCIQQGNFTKAESGELVLFVGKSTRGNDSGLSWFNAFTDLQAAIDSAASIATDSLPVQIWIAEGTYFPTISLDRDASFSMKSNVAIYGGFLGIETEISQRNFVDNETVLSGNIGDPNDSTDNSNHVILNVAANFDQRVRKTAVLDGFVVERGFFDTGASTDGGAGMKNYFANPTVRNTIFRYNVNAKLPTAPGFGGLNGVGGAVRNDMVSSPDFISCTFHNNVANQGGALAFLTLSSIGTGNPANVINCLFFENEAVSSGSAFYSSNKYTVNLFNNTFADNTETGAGSSSATNFPFYSGAFIYRMDGLNPNIENNIFWGNTSPTGEDQLWLRASSGAVFERNVVEDDFDGIRPDDVGTLPSSTIFGFDPQFVDNSSRDYSLEYCSPAVDNGSSTNFPQDIEQDILGSSRIANSTIDLGAFEEQSDFKPSFSSPSPTDVSCNGGGDGSFFANAAGSFSPFTYSIDGVSFASSNAATGLSAGNYTYYVKDSNGCLDSIDFAITEPVVLSATITSTTDVTCNGDGDGQLMINAAGGTTPYTYSVDGANFVSDALFTGLLGGSYIVTVKDANDCLVTESVTLNESDALVLTQDAINNVSCSGETDGTISVSTVGGITPFEYSINNGSFDVISSFSNLAAGNYTVVVRDANICTASTTVTVTEPMLLSTTSTGTNTTTCLATDGVVEVTPTGGTSPYSYQLDGGVSQTSNTFSGLGAGLYSVTISDANGCKVEIDQLIDDPVTSTVTTTQTNVSCNGLLDGSVSLTVTGGTTPILYSLDGGTTSQSESTFSGLGAGSYSITVTEDSGCRQTVSITITEPAEVFGVLTLSDPTCFGTDSGSITVTASGGTGTYEYSLDGTNFQSENEFTVLTAGSYTITIKDGNGCLTTNTGVLEDPVEITSTTAIVNASCQGAENGTITVSASNAVAPLSFSLDGGITQASNVFDFLNPGSYSIEIVDDNGCSITVSDVVVGENVTITPTATLTDVLCSGESNGIISASATGGTAPYEYSLDGTTFQTAAEFGSLAAGDYTITVRDTNGCLGTVVVTVEEPDVLSVTVVQTSRDFNVTATGGTAPYEYSSDGSTFLTSASFAGLDPGDYTFSVRDANGCITSSDEFSIVLAIDQIENEIVLYPNPVADYFLIESMEVKSVEVYDVNGKRQNVSKTGDKVDVSQLSKGTYLIQMKDDEGKVISINRILKTN